MIGLITATPTHYADPTLHEMVGLAQDYGIIQRTSRTERGLRMEVLGEPMDLSSQAAAVLLKGLLLGYFYSQSRNDLTRARWED